MSYQTLEDAAVTFLAFRDRLFGIAFRILNDSAAAIGVQRRTGDEAGARRGEKQHRLGDFGGMRGPAQW